MRHLAIVGSGSGARYSANFDKEPTSSWVFSLSMTETEFGQQNAAQRTAGRMLTAVTLYGGSAAADRRYGAVWVANPGAVTWAAFVTSAAEFNGFAAGMAAAPMRATHMIPAPNNAVAVSVWVDTTLGQWKAVIRVSSSEYQAAYDAAIADGYLPVGAIGGGSATSGIRYGGIFAKNNDAPFPRVWSQTATAPSSSASNALAVDNAVKAYMKAVRAPPPAPAPHTPRRRAAGLQEEDRVRWRTFTLPLPPFVLPPPPPSPHRRPCRPACAARSLPFPRTSAASSRSPSRARTRGPRRATPRCPPRPSCALRPCPRRSARRRSTS
jgi:hypothetical protein